MTDLSDLPVVDGRMTASLRLPYSQALQEEVDNDNLST